MPEPTETVTPEAPKAEPNANSLESLLADLDEEKRKVILGEVGKSRSEAKNLRDRLKDAEPKVAEYDRLAEASKSDLERATEKLTAAEQRAIAAERTAMVNAVALEKGLTPALAKRLQGDTLEALQADADELVQFVQSSEPQSRVPRADPSQGSSASGAAATDPAQAFATFIKNQRA